jgi:D-proline reductase (dithiol) PrdB
MLELSRSCIPYTPLKRELKDCRIALVSTSGAYVEGMQPFNSDGDLTYRLIPTDTDTKKIRFMPGHFDTSKGAEDPNIMFPLDRLREMAAGGEIGGLTENHLSMGLTTELRKLKEVVSWEIAEIMMKMRPTIVLLTGG